MSHKASAKQEHHRKTIRKAQIHNYFTLRRQMMLCIGKQEAVDMLLPHLGGLREFALYESNAQDLRLIIQKIEQILRKYDCLNFLIRSIDFGSSKLAEMKFGPQYREMTCIDVLLYVLNTYGEDLDLNAQCSYILSKCAQEFKYKIIKKRCFQNKSIFQRQFNRLVEGFPFSLVLDADPRTAANALSLLTEVSLACNNGGTIYYLLNKLNPNIVLLLNSLMERQNLMASEEVRSELMRAAVTMVYFIARYNYVKFQAQEFVLLTQKIKHILLNIMLRSDNMQEFNQGCWHLRLLFDSGIITLNRNELLLLQGMIEAELRNNSLMFFGMFKMLMVNTRTVLRPESIKVILSRIFEPEESSQDAIKMKLNLITVYHYQIINGGNRFKEEDAEMFIGHWGQYSRVDRLLALLKLFDDASEEKGISEMMTLLDTLFCFDSEFNINEIVEMTPEEYRELRGFQARRSATLVLDSLPDQVEQL